MVAGVLFLVISTPRPERPSEVAARRTAFWPWLDALRRTGVCRWGHARVGRGAAVLLDVRSNERLHRLLNEWADIVPATFDVYPLVDAAATRRLLARQVAAARRRAP